MRRAPTTWAKSSSTNEKYDLAVRPEHRSDPAARSFPATGRFFVSSLGASEALIGKKSSYDEPFSGSAA